jgi:hypothetical protein
MIVVAGGSVALSEVAKINKGAEKIKLVAGRRGPVSFPHRRHQDKLGDCDICHSIFPQKAGIIEELKAQGKLKKKQIMNKNKEPILCWYSAFREVRGKTEIHLFCLQPSCRPLRD